MSLPSFSQDLEAILKTQQLWAGIDRIIEQTAYWVLGHGDMKERSEYDDFGARMVAKYPLLRVDDENKRPHAFLMKKLSRKLRNLRGSSKKRSETFLKSGGQKPKRRKSGQLKDQPSGSKTDNTSAPETITTTPIILSGDTDFKNNLKELKQACTEEVVDSAKVKVLMDRTFKNRRAWLKERQGTGVKAVLERYPPLKEGNFFKDVLLRILAVTWDELVSNFQDMLAKLERMFDGESGEESGEESDEVSSDEKAMAIILNLDKATKWRSVNKDKMLVELVNDIPKGSALGAPRLVVLDQEDTLCNCFVLYDREVIDCECDSFIESMIFLVGAYYIFYLAYPTAYVGVLGFIQAHVFKDSANEFHKTNKYVEFSKKFAEV